MPKKLNMILKDIETQKREQDLKQANMDLQNNQKTIKNGNNEYLPINNYFKCKYIKFANQKT